jgi:hypothetical protein
MPLYRYAPNLGAVIVDNPPNETSNGVLTAETMTTFVHDFILLVCVANLNFLNKIRF